MSTYLAAKYWAGALNVSSIRVFNTELEAREYLIKDCEMDERDTSFFRIYELTSSSPPRLCKQTNEYTTKQKQSFKKQNLYYADRSRTKKEKGLTQ